MRDGIDMIGLFLDDERNPEDVTWIKYPDNVEWVVVRNSDEFFRKYHAWIFMGMKFVVSFDHDIQEFDIDTNEELTGYGILQKMLDTIQLNKLSIPKCYFHTQNPVGKENMEMYYKNFLEFHEKEETS